MNRAVLKWLQTLNLSLPYRNPREDFASGYLVSEIVGHFIKLETVYINSVKEAQRKDNWEQLQKVFDNPNNHMSIPSSLCISVMKRDEKAYITLLEKLYERFTHRKVQHVKIGEISKKPTPAPTANVQDIEKPKITKQEVQEKEPDVPPVIPKRQRFIGSSSQLSNPSDLTPITFESASVVKSGPGFLQLRNTATPAMISDDTQQLNTIYDELLKENEKPTQETLTSLIQCLSEPNALLSFFNTFPTDRVIHYLKIISPNIPHDISSYLIFAIGTYLIPALNQDPDITISKEETIDFICNLSSADSFSQHFLFSRIIEFSKPEEIPAYLLIFLEHSQNISPQLAIFISNKIHECINNDPEYCLPSVLALLMQSNKGANFNVGLPLLELFPPHLDKTDFHLIDLYLVAPKETMSHIVNLLQQGDRGIAAYLLLRLVQEEKMDMEELTQLLLIIPDPKALLEEPYVVNGKPIDPVKNVLNPLIVSQSIVSIVQREKPANLSHEVIIMDVLMTGTELLKCDEWHDIFMGLYDYLYLAFCDVEICKEATDIVYLFFKMLQNDVFQTFTVLYKTLSMIFPSQTNCPAECKTATIEFLMKASDISLGFGQNILKLLMSFPPKTHPDLDKLIATLRKVKRQ